MDLPLRRLPETAGEVRGSKAHLLEDVLLLLWCVVSELHSAYDTCNWKPLLVGCYRGIVVSDPGVLLQQGIFEPAATGRSAALGSEAGEAYTEYWRAVPWPRWKIVDAVCLCIATGQHGSGF